MPNQEHLAILEKGVRAWNQWRQENPTVVPNLNNADLLYAELSGINLGRADLGSVKLAGANLSGANLLGASLSSARLRATNLRSANLGLTYLAGATLQSAMLADAILTGADLFETDFRKTELVGTDFTGAIMNATDLTQTSLSGAKGLANVEHHGPSIIGIDTIYLSHGRIPEAFLRGCGVPENLIHYIPSLVDSEEGMQFYSCFISYSGKDEDFTRRLHSRMREAQLRVWFAPEDIQGGKKLDEQIESAIRVYDKLLIVLSKASLRSEWVMKELRKAFETERRSGKRKLFPVRLTDYRTLKRWECHDSKSGKDLAEELRQYFIPDFSNWKDHDQFEAAFGRLLNDLRADESAK
jgi:uncharacterized protein YjbI with pentapeptide repeats